MQNDVVVYEKGEQSLAVTRDPAEVLAEAQHAAECLVKVVSGKKKPVIFNGEQYLEFEDWQTVGKFYHVASKAISTEEVIINDGVGFKAHAIAIDTVTGAVVSEADALCLNSEPNWANKPMFQLCSMAQTRACAKALRNVLAWVVVLAGYRPTPAEEVPAEGFPSASNGKSEGKPHSATPQPAKKQDANELMGFGKHKDKAWADCPSGYLEWLAAQIDEKTGKPSERALRAKVELDMRKPQVQQAMESGTTAKDGPPTDEQLARLDKCFAATDSDSQEFWESFKDMNNSQFTAAEAQKWIEYFENPDLRDSVGLDAFLDGMAMKFGLSA
jgi:hypothetical protein